MIIEGASPLQTSLCKSGGISDVREASPLFNSPLVFSHLDKEREKRLGY